MRKKTESPEPVRRLIVSGVLALSLMISASSQGPTCERRDQTTERCPLTSSLALEITQCTHTYVHACMHVHT